MTIVRAPSQLGSYEPLMELAAGGMATVYVARKIGLGGFERLCVVKRVHPHLLGNREFHDMFRDEARVASLIHHPNVVPVTDIVELESELLLVMEYIDSVSLGTLLKEASARNEKVPVPVVARIVLDALAGLHAAHSAVDMLGNPLQVVHRDVSPQNIVVGADGMSRIIDFGIAQAADRLTDTKTGSLKGKIAYMAPEQAAGSKHLDRRIDVFAAGVTLYEALTATRLFRGENDVETLKRILELVVPPPSALRTEVTKELDEVTLRALVRDPDKRYASAREFHEALEAASAAASISGVATCVRQHCGERLDNRARRLRSVLEGSISVAGSMRAIPAAPTSTPTLEPRGEKSGATSASLALPSERVPAGPPPKNRWLVVGMSGTLLVGLGVGLGMMVSSRSRNAPVAAEMTAPAKEPVASAAAPSPTTPSATATDAGPSVGPVFAVAPATGAAVEPPAAASSSSAAPTVAPNGARAHAVVTKPRATTPSDAKKKTELQDNPYK